MEHKDPIVVLHGGPGIPDLAENAAYFGQLATLGHPVYTYAQLGSGPSTRLDDPRGYGLERDVADLESIRRTLRAPRLILVGHSYGAALAANYLAAYPDRVAALVLSSPAPLDPHDRSSDRASARLTTGQRMNTYRLVSAPRALLGYLLLQVNPAAAHAYFPDPEADARNDRVITAAAPGLHCDRSRSWPATRGSGFYAHQYPQSATSQRPPDIRDRLSALSREGLKVEVLLIKGGCDYLSWQSALDYRRVLPETRLVYLPVAGHNTYADQPQTVLACIRAFLDHQDTPVPTYTSDDQPPGYQG
ncbi:alpha/beta hydrolase [Georgenia sp. TF02-10]|uniref:alpha/beta fold hydrolase n=1 Tax=Georgenia sp. TF02-10 TaxID=2917725 RepID=UPI001FA7216D|nr:alpha/beta hydrolase [Georgenia sp. TF02-10]UNX56249.1 alpha/beta hydrolase [Georgenia sp. TF02-10]